MTMPRWLWLLGAIVAGGATGPDVPDPPPAAPSPEAIVAALETALTDAIARAEPSVVAIARKRSEGSTETTAVRGRGAAHEHPELLPRTKDNPFGEDQISFDFGAGVVVGDRGEILTTWDVVKGAAWLHVRAAARQEFDAEIIATDPRSNLAVVAPKEAQGRPEPKLRPIALGDASKLRKGAFLLALGNPYNSARDGRPSASWGILANVARSLPLSPEDLAPGLRNHPTLLQLDSKLNIGMSGGAVINLKGELVGLTTVGSNVVGYDAAAGYAIPMDTLGRRIVQTLREGKEYEHGLLGIRLDPGGSNRVRLAQPGTPAAEGGIIQTDDEIIAVDDIPVTDVDSLILAINAFAAGTRVRLKLLRNGEVLDRTIELAKRPLDEPVIATNRPPPWRGLRVDYSSTVPEAVHGRVFQDALSRGGVTVTEVLTGSPAERAGLKPGMMITHIDGKPVRSPRAFAEAVAGRDGPVDLVATDLGVVTVR